MDWQTVSPGIERGHYAGFDVTRIHEKRDAYGIDIYTFIAVRDKTRYASKSFREIKSKIHKSMNQQLF